MSQKNKLKFEGVWLAQHKRAISISKTIVFGDKNGELVFDKECQTFSYVGENIKLNDCKILGIVFRNQKFSIIGFVKYSWIVFVLLSLKRNLLYGFLGFSIGMILALIGWYFARWVVIEYKVPNEDKNELVWFFDGNYIGWSGFLGGSRKMFNKIIDFFEVRSGQK